MALYDDDCYQGVRMLKIRPIGTLAGTCATAARLVDFTVPPGMNGEVLGYSAVVNVDGTDVAAAGPGVTFNRSLAGTGTKVPLGTLTLVGTNAVGKQYTGTMTTKGTFLAGDVLSVWSVAGSVATLPREIDVYLTWRERAV
jgi:hypothetical protein